MTTDYAHLAPDTVADWLAANRDVSAAAGIDPAAIASVEEVGDGNLNLVFIVHDAGGHGIVLKQALPYVRLVGPEWPMTPERARHEHDALVTHAVNAPDLVPIVYGYDADRYIIAMEDLSDHRVWRGALCDGEQAEGAATALGEFVASYAFATSVLGLPEDAHKAAAVRSSNPDLCKITEDLVFTEPVDDIGRNSVEPGNESDAAELATDAVFVAELGRAKWTFMNAAEAQIHGDLHTGSVMLRGSGESLSIKAIDPEFSFYGPVAFDIGALWGNYVLAAARAFALDDAARAEWCLQLIPHTWASFEQGIRDRWPQRRSPVVFSDAFGESLLVRWRIESWAFAAAKMARRIVGLAKAADIETLPVDAKVPAARGVLAVARMAMREKQADSDPFRFATLAADTLTTAIR